MEQSRKDVDPLHQLFGKLWFLNLLSINELKRDLSALTEPPDPNLFNERPQLGGRFAQRPIKLPIEETCVPLTVLQ